MPSDQTSPPVIWGQREFPSRHAPLIDCPNCGGRHAEWLLGPGRAVRCGEVVASFTLSAEMSRRIRGEPAALTPPAEAATPA